MYILFSLKHFFNFVVCFCHYVLKGLYFYFFLLFLSFSFQFNSFILVLQLALQLADFFILFFISVNVLFQVVKMDVLVNDKSVG